MQDSKFNPIDEKYKHHDYVNDIYPFEIRYAFNSFAPYSIIRDGNKLPYIKRFVENTFKSETGAGNIVYYSNIAEYSELIKLYDEKKLYTLVDDEIVCIDNNSLLYSFIERFREGFTRGYFEVKNNLEIENDIQRVFDIAINESLSGLDTAYETHNYIKFLSDELIFESGVKTGRNYRAWQVVLDKSYLYVQLFRKSETLIGYYRWSLEYETERKTPNDVWGRKKGLEILLKYDIDPQLLEKEEKKMLDIGSLKPVVKKEKEVKESIQLPAPKEIEQGKVFKLIKDATPKERAIINAFKEETDKPRMTQATALNILSKKTDLGVGKVEKPNFASNKKQIHDILKSFGLALKEK